MQTKIGKIYSFADLESLRHLDPVSMDDIEELEKVLKPIFENAQDMGLTDDDVRKIKKFVTQIKQRAISTQEGEQRDYEHNDLQYPDDQKTSITNGPSGRSEQENSMSGVSATPGA